MSTYCQEHWKVVPESRDSNDPINGIVASIRLTEAFVIWVAEIDIEEYERYLALGHSSSSAMNRIMSERGPVCCLLGDTVVHETMESSRRSKCSVLENEREDVIIRASKERNREV